MSMSIKAGLLLASIIIALASGYYYGKGDKEIERVEIKGETVIQWKERTVVHEVVRTVQPDGTVTETIRDVARETEQESKEITSVVGEKSKPVNSRYSLGLYTGPISAKESVHEGLSAYDYKKDWMLEGGIRIGGPVWGTLLVAPLTKSLALGVRIEL